MAIDRRRVVCGIGVLSLGASASAAWRFDAIAQGAREVQGIRALADLAGGSENAVVVNDGGRSGLFRWDGRDHSRAVSADAVRGVYVAPRNHSGGADGAWVRAVDGPFRPEWFGAVGDGVVNDDAAMFAMTDLGRHHGRLHVRFTQGRTYTYKHPFLFSCIRDLHIDGSGAAVMNLAGHSKDETFFANYEGLQFAPVFYTSGPENYRGSLTPFDLGTLTQTARPGSRKITLLAPSQSLQLGSRALIYGYDGLGGAGGFPPCPRFFEYVRIADVNGLSVTLEAPLKYGYDSRWSEFKLGTKYGPPRLVSADRRDFVQCENLKINDLHIRANPGWTAPGGNHERNGRLTLAGFDTAILDRVTIDGTFYVSQGNRAIIRNCSVRELVESDKCLSHVTYENVRMRKHILGNGTRRIDFIECDIDEYFVANPIEELVIRGGRIRGDSGGSRAMLGLYGGVTKIDIRGTHFVCKGKPRDALLPTTARSVKVQVASDGILEMTMADYLKSQICRAVQPGVLFYDKSGYPVLRLTEIPYQSGEIMRMHGDFLGPIKSGDVLHISFLNDVTIADVRYVGDYGDQVTTMGTGAPNSPAGFRLIDQHRGETSWRLPDRAVPAASAPNHYFLAARVKARQLAVTVSRPDSGRGQAPRLILRSGNGPAMATVDLTQAGTRRLEPDRVSGAKGGDLLVPLGTVPLHVLRYHSEGVAASADQLAQWSFELLGDPIRPR